MPKKPTRIEIYDTTLRDGAQSEGVSLSLQDKLQITAALDRLGVDYIEGGYPLSNPKDAEFFTEVKKLNLTTARVVAFGMTRRKGVSCEDDAGMTALLSANTDVVCVVGKSWKLHVDKVLGVSPDENLAMIAESVAHLTAAGKEVFFDAEHFTDGWLDDQEYATGVLKAAAKAGATRLVLCDTNGGATMDQIAKMMSEVCKALPESVIGIHCHNDCSLAVANSIIAVRHGARQVQGTINGLGERCGNADLTSVVANLMIKYDYECLKSGALKKLTEASRFVYEVANLNFREDQPFVGAAAFAHKGGMHVHAMQKNVTTYEHMDPTLVGNARRILVSELSGMSNVAATAPAKFNLTDDRKAQHTVLKALMELENDGYQFEAAEASFELLIRKTLGGKWYHKSWDLDHYRCVILKQHSRKTNTEAVVKLSVNGGQSHTVSEGDGPVDSLHVALCTALRAHYPQVDDLHLMDYKVRVVNTSAGTAAKVRVVIDWHDTASEKYFGSVGVSENIIEASWLAVADAMEYKVLNQ